MNVENLLGKLLQGTISSGGNQYGGSQAKRNAGGGSLLGSLVNQLTSGQGLMTAVGLGVGAYEILSNNKGQQAAPPPPVPPNAENVAGPRMTPPPPPPMSPLSQAPVQSAPLSAAPPASDDQAMALRLIQVMVAAAHADGTLDADEEKNILDRLRAANLTQEEKMFLLEELHHPKTLAEVTADVSDLRLAKTMYAVALSAITVDTDSERQWLNDFGASLGLSAEICRFIEETC